MVDKSNLSELSLQQENNCSSKDISILLSSLVLKSDLSKKASKLNILEFVSYWKA